MEVYCRCCKEAYDETGLIGCDAIYLCRKCKQDRIEDVNKICMNDHQYWNGCNIGCAKGMCDSCNYNDICTIKDTQTHDTRGKTGSNN